MKFFSILIALFFCTAWFGGCTRPVVEKPKVDCGPAAVTYCPAPIMTADNVLGQTESEDSINRSLARECAADHRVVVDCLHALNAAGVIEVPPNQGGH